MNITDIQSLLADLRAPYVGDDLRCSAEYACSIGTDGTITHQIYLCDVTGKFGQMRFFKRGSDLDTVIAAARDHIATYVSDAANLSAILGYDVTGATPMQAAE